MLVPSLAQPDVSAWGLVCFVIQTCVIKYSYGIRKIIISYVILWLGFRFTMDALIMYLECGCDIIKEQGNPLLRTTTSQMLYVPLWSSLMDEECKLQGIPCIV